MLAAKPRNSIAPHGNLLKSIAEQNLHWKEVLGEVIDNSFDAGATSVEVVFGSIKNGRHQSVSVIDNGSGCSNVLAMLTLGGREQHKTTRLGRFGVGLKDFLLWCGGVEASVSITSVHGKRKRHVGICWSDVIARNDWDLGEDAVSEAAVGPGARGGTTVTVRPVKRSLPSGKDWDSLLDTVGYTFSPAIRAGCQISFKRDGKDSVPVPVRRWELPELEEVVKDVLDVGGKKVRIHVGIVKQGIKNTRPGLTYWHGHRVIVPATSSGCGGMDTSRIAGVVELSDGWVLTKNKDNISHDAERLYESVLERIRPLLLKAEVSAHCLEIDALRAATESLVNGIVFGDKEADPDSKAKRGEGDKSGTQQPTGKGKRHQSAKNQQPGRTFGGRRCSSLSIQFGPMVDEKIGRFDDAGRIYIDEENPIVVQARREKNHLAIALIALSILSSAESFTEKQLKLQGFGPTPSDKFCSVLGHLTQRPVHMNGQQVGNDNGLRVPTPGGSA